MYSLTVDRRGRFGAIGPSVSRTDSARPTALPPEVLGLPGCGLIGSIVPGRGRAVQREGQRVSPCGGTKGAPLTCKIPARVVS